MYCTSITHYMMGNMTVKLPRIRPYFSYSVLCYWTTTNTTVILQHKCRVIANSNSGLYTKLGISGNIFKTETTFHGKGGYIIILWWVARSSFWVKICMLSLCKRSRKTCILCKRSKLLVTWLLSINNNVTYPLWCNIVA